MRSKKKKSPRKQGNPARALWIFLVFTTMVLLSFVSYKEAMDRTLMPRLLGLGLILLVTTPFVFRLYKKEASGGGLPFLFVFPLFAVYILISVVSLFFARNPSAGYFDVVKSVLLLIFLMYAAWLMVHYPNWRTTIGRFATITVFIMTIYGSYLYLETLGWGFHDRGEITRLLRGIMSNVNLFSSQLLFVLPFAVYTGFTDKTLWRRFAGLAIIAALVLLIMLQTRAVFAGIMGFAATGIVLGLWFRKQLGVSKELSRIVVITMGVLLLGFISLFLLPSGTHPLVARVQSMVSAEASGGRTLLWKMTGRMIADQPLTGVGAGNWTLEIQPYYEPFGYPYKEVNWLRPHNDFLWVFAEKGIFGFMLFMAFFILLYVYGIRYARGPDASGEGVLFAILMMSGITAYLANSMFDFPLERISHQIMLFLYAASIVALYYKDNPDDKRLKSIGAKTCLYIALLLIGAGSWYAYTATRQEGLIREIRMASEAEQWNRVLDLSKKAKTPLKRLDPLAVPVEFFEGFAYSKLGRNIEAEQKWEISYKLNPNRQYMLENMTIVKYLLDKFDEAIFYGEKLLEMYPNVSPLNHQILSESHLQTGSPEKALEALLKVPRNSRDQVIQHDIVYIRSLIRAENKED